MKDLNSKTNRWLFFAAAQFYLTFSIFIGTWVLYIPEISEKLLMTNQQLGVALFFGALGSIASLPFAKKLTQRVGEGLMSFASVIGLSVGIIYMFLSPSYEHLCAGLFVFGFGGGFFQVAVNSMVAVIEYERKITIMSACHGFFSLGGLISSGLGTALLIWIGSATLHIVLVVIFVMLLQAVFIWQYHTIKDKRVIESAPENTKNRRIGILFWLAIIALSVMVTEGGIADWSGLYLKNVVKAKPEYLGLGYAGFSLSMTIGRFTGDMFSKRFGAIPIIFTGFLLSVLGFALILTQQWEFALGGFFIVGAGFSVIIPEVFRLSANLQGVNPSSGIAFLSAASYVGFLGGPVAFGFVAETFGLIVSFSGMLGLAFLGTSLVAGSFVYKFNRIGQIG